MSTCTLGVQAQSPLPPIVCYFPLCVFLVSSMPLPSHVFVVSLASLVYLVFLVSTFTLGVPAQYPLAPIVCYLPLFVFSVSSVPLRPRVSVVSLASLVYLVFLVSLVPLVSQPSMPYLLLYVTFLYVESVSSMPLPSHVSVVSILLLVCLTSFVSPVSHLDLQSLSYFCMGRQELFPPSPRPLSPPPPPHPSSFSIQCCLANDCNNQSVAPRLSLTVAPSASTTLTIKLILTLHQNSCLCILCPECVFVKAVGLEGKRLHTPFLALSRAGKTKALTASQ